MKIAIENIRTILAAINYMETEESSTYSIDNSDVRLLTEALRDMESSSHIIRWVDISENIEPKHYSDVIIKLKDGNKTYATFQPDNRFYNECDYDITDEVQSYMIIPN